MMEELPHRYFSTLYITGGNTTDEMLKELGEFTGSEEYKNSMLKLFEIQENLFEAFKKFCSKKTQLNTDNFYITINYNAIKNRNSFDFFLEAVDNNTKKWRYKDGQP